MLVFVACNGRGLHSLVVRRLYLDEGKGIRRPFLPMLEAAAKVENS